MASKTPFVHLHLHTNFSLLDGACRIKPLIEAAGNMNMPAVGLTDHGVMYGTVDFFTAAKSAGIKPLIGCEVYMAPGSHKDRQKHADTNKQAYHFVLLAKNYEGYQNLIRLVTTAHLDGFYYKPRIDKELLARHHKGLIGLSACLASETSQALLTDDDSKALHLAGEFADILGEGNYYLELQDHGLTEQHKVNKGILALARKTGLPLVCSNDVHYLEKSHAHAHEVMLCMQTGTVMSSPKRLRYGAYEFYFKSGDEMLSLFREVPEAVSNTLLVADQCDLELDFNTPHFPTYEVPEGMTQKDYLVELCHAGLKERYDVGDPKNPKSGTERELVERFLFELSVIEKTGFINYFLVVWDFVRFSLDNDIPVGPGRGSGAGSLVAYILHITDIDPIRYGLIFERFLNPDRVSPPDFDIDFCQARRGEVIEYVKQKYGRENVAQIITFGSLGAKTVIRDVGRALEIPFAECDRLAKMIPDDPKMTLAKAMEDNPEFKQAYERDDTARQIVDYGEVLEGLTRQPGTHAAGVVIGEKPLQEIIPLARDKDGEIITQYSMEPLGELGLLKMDFLGLKTLTVIQEAIELVEQTRGITIDLQALPMDNKPAYELLARGDTIGVFQLESSGMRELLRRINAKKIEDLIALIALYRPGPMNLLDDFVERRAGRMAIEYDHPLLEPVLEETYGVVLYQEQVQKATNVLAGFSLAQGDILRRAMGKKKAEEMQKQRADFIAGCKTTNDIDAKTAGAIFDKLEKFAGYGFNKSHSAAYGIISYRTAYLKALYPEEFMCALLSSEIGNSTKLPVFINEVKEMGLTVYGPDVNASRVRFGPEEGGVRFGLAGVKNVGAAASEAIVAERAANGPYTDLLDFCVRLDCQLVNKKAIESLIRSGAFDALESNRARYFNGIDFAFARAAAAHRDRDSGQGNLFDLIDPEADVGGNGNSDIEELPDAEPWPETEMLSAEKELLGMYLTGHPLVQYEHLLKRYPLSTIANLGELTENSMTRLGGLVTACEKKITKKKDTMAIVQLEDLEGNTEVVVFPEAYREYGPLLEAGAAVLVCGEVSRRDEQPKLNATEVYPLADAPKHFAKRISVHVPVTNGVEKRLEKIRDTVRSHPGRVPVTVCMIMADSRKVFIEADRAFRVLPNDALIQELEHINGEDSIYVTVDKTPGKNGARTRKRWGNS